MGYTHFDKPVGVNGLFVGPKDSEVSVSTGNQVLVVNFGGDSTAAEAAYVVVPYACNLVAGYIDLCSGTSGTGCTVAIFQNDTAGTALFGSVAIASAGTAGSTTYTMGTMSTATVAALSSLAIVKASSATAYGCTVTIVASKAGN